MTTLEIGWEKIPENGWELNPRSQLVPSLVPRHGY
jgi:hypothetical protein